MDNNDICRQIKQNIELLINNKKLDEAKKLIDEYLKVNEDDAEIYSMQAVISMCEGNINNAENILKDALNKYDSNYDLNYNLAYVYEQEKKYNDALRYYTLALRFCSDENMKKEIRIIISKLENEYGAKLKRNRKRIVFFDKGDDKFIWDIINELSKDYEIKHIKVTSYNQINEGMKWADICWFEWCDELIAYGSKLEIAKEKKIICRLHRYEALTDYPKNVKWENVDKLIIVADHLKKFLLAQMPDLQKRVDIVAIRNGVNLDKYKFQERKPGFNIAYVGYIHMRKNPSLLLQIINALVKRDNRYKLFVAGEFQDYLVKQYWDYEIKQMSLEKNVVFQGWQNDINRWLMDKNYILSASIHESFGYGIAEAMARGIKPVIHNFLFANEIWDKNYLFNDIDEAINLIMEKKYDSKNYRKYINDHYSLDNQIKSIKNIIKVLMEENKNNSLTVEYLEQRFNDFIPYSPLDIDKFDFKDSFIVIGKKEILFDNIRLIEFIVRNKNKQQLVLTNILYDGNKIIYPNYIKGSKNIKVIDRLINSNMDLGVKQSTNIQGYIFDKDICNDVKENQLAYIWERGIPATQSMPALGWLKIIERYKFASNFIKPSDTILEAASGFGYGAAYFHNKCKEIFALDLAQENINFGKCSYDFDNISWINGDVTKLPFENDKFNVYTSFETLEHLPLNIIDNYFKEALRVLKNDGIMIISTPNREMRKNVHNPFHIKEYNYNEFDEILRRYFSNINYYSTSNYKIEEGINSNSIDMIAICSNPIVKVDGKD